MASIIDIEFRASANFSDLVSQVNVANAQIQKLSLSMRKLNAEGFGSAVNSFTRALSSSGQFNTQSLLIDNGITKFGKALDAGNLNLQNSSRALRDFVRGRDGQIKQLARQQVMLERSVWTPTGRTAQGQMRGVLSTPTGLPNDVATNAAVATRQMQIFHSVLNETSKGLVNWGKNTQWAGRQMMVGLSIPLSIFGTVAAKTFMNFDKELTRLSRVYGSSITSSGTQAIDAIKKQVTELAGEISKALGIPAAETAALAADLAATGLEGDKLLGAVKQTSILATLGEVDRQDAMKTTLSLQNVFGASTKQLTEDINFLNAVENQTTASIQDLTTAIPKAGPVVRGLGGDVKDLATMLVAMKEGGIPAGEAANAIKSSLSSLINPTKEVSKYMKGFGIDLTEIVDKNAGKLMPTLTEFQGKLNALDDLSRQRVLEKLFGKMQVGRITALFNNLNQEGSQSAQVMKLAGTAAADLATLTEQELSKAANSVSGKFKRAAEDLKANLVPIGEQFLKFGTSVLGVLDKIIRKFNNLPSGFKQFLIGLATLTALVGPVIMLVGVFANFAGYLLRFGVLLAAFKKGGLQAFKYLTAEEMAAKLAGDKLTQTMFNQTKATNVFKEAVGQLALQFKDLADSATAAAKATSSASQSPAGRAASSRVAIPSAVSVGSSTQVAQEPASLVAPTGEQLTESYKRMAAGGVAGRYLLSAADPNIVSSDGNKFKDRDAYNRSHLLSKTDPFWNNRALSGLGLMPSPSWKNQMQLQMSEANPRFGFSTSLRESAPSEENRKIAADSARNEVDAARTELAAAKRAASAKNAGADAATRVAEAEVKLAAVTETYRQKLFEASSYKASEVRKTQATMFGQTRYLAENPEQAAVIGKELQQLSPAARQKKMQDLGIGGEDDQAFIKKVQESTKKRAARKLQAELDAETQAAKAADPSYKRLAKSSSEYKYRLAKYETDEFNKSLVRLEQGLQARARATGYDIRTPLYGGGGASSGVGHLTPSSVSTPQDTAASKALNDAKIAHAQKLNELTASLSAQETAGADLSEAQIVAAEALTTLTGQRELAEAKYKDALAVSAELTTKNATNPKRIAAEEAVVAAEAALVTAIDNEILALGGLTNETRIETEQYAASNPTAPTTTTGGSAIPSPDKVPGEKDIVPTGKRLPSLTKVGMGAMTIGAVGSMVGPKQGTGANITTGLLGAGTTAMMVGQMLPEGTMLKMTKAAANMAKLGGITGQAGKAFTLLSSAGRAAMAALLGPIGIAIAVVAALGVGIWYVNKRVQDAAKTTQSFMTVSSDMATLFNQKLNGMKANLTGLSENIDAARKRYEELKKAIDALDKKSPIKKLIEDLKNEANPDVSIPAKLTSMYSALVLQGLDPQKARDSIQVILDEAGQGKYKMVVNAEIDKLNIKDSTGKADAEKTRQAMINATFDRAIIGASGADKYNAAVATDKAIKEANALAKTAAKSAKTESDKVWTDMGLVAETTTPLLPGINPLTLSLFNKENGATEIGNLVKSLQAESVKGVADELNNMLGEISAVNPAGFSKFVEDLEKSNALKEGFWMDPRFREQFINDLGVVGTKYEDLIRNENSLAVAAQLAFLAQSGVSDAMAQNAYEADKAANSFGTATSAIEAMVVAGTISKQLSLDISKNAPVVKASATASGKAAAVNSGYDAQKKTIEDRIKAIKAEMDAINKKLEAEKAEQDFLKKTRDLQISYREALASGNLGEAARIKNDLNNERLKRAQELSAKDKLDPKQAEIDKLQKRLDAIDKLKDAANNKTTQNSGVDPAKQTKDLENAWTKVTDGISDGSIKSSSDIKKLLGTGVVDAVKGAGYSIDEFYNKARQTIKDSIQGSVKDLDETGQAVWKAYSKGSKDLADQLRTARIMSYVSARGGNVEEALRLKQEGKLNVATNKSGEITDVSVKGDVPRSIARPGTGQAGATAIYGVDGPKSVQGNSANTDLAKSIGGEFDRALKVYDAGDNALRVRGFAGREHGGPVKANTPYIVGERRPEVFVPSTDGTIIPQVPGEKPGYGAYFSGSYSNSALFEASDPVKSNAKKDKKSVANTGSGDSTSPSFSFTGTPGSIDSAMAFLDRQAASGASTWSNLCERLARTAYGMPGMYASALDHFRAIPDSKVHGKSTATAPKGALGFWNTGPYGHIAISAGGGRFYSNMSDGKVRLVSSELLNSWGPILGVTEPWWSNKYNASAGINGTLPTYLTASYSEAQRNKGNGGFAEKGFGLNLPSLVPPPTPTTPSHSTPGPWADGYIPIPKTWGSQPYSSAKELAAGRLKREKLERKENRRLAKFRKAQEARSTKEKRSHLAYWRAKEAGPETFSAYNLAKQVGNWNISAEQLSLLDSAGISRDAHSISGAVKLRNYKNREALWPGYPAPNPLDPPKTYLSAAKPTNTQSLNGDYTEDFHRKSGFMGLLHKAGKLLETPYEQGVARVLSTSLLLLNTGNGMGGLNPKEAWNNSKFVSPGQALLGGLDALNNKWTHRDRNKTDSNITPEEELRNAIANRSKITHFSEEGILGKIANLSSGAWDASFRLLDPVTYLPINWLFKGAKAGLTAFPNAMRTFNALNNFKPFEFVEGMPSPVNASKNARRATSNLDRRTNDKVAEQRRLARTAAAAAARQQKQSEKESENFFSPNYRHAVNPVAEKTAVVSDGGVKPKAPTRLTFSSRYSARVEADKQRTTGWISDGGVKPKPLTMSPVEDKLWEEAAIQLGGQVGNESINGLSPAWKKILSGAVNRVKEAKATGSDRGSFGFPESIFKSSKISPEYVDRAKEIQKLLDIAHAEASSGRFADMPVTELGKLVDVMGGRSSSIPGLNGVYKNASGRVVIKGHDTSASALAEVRSSQLSREIFGLDTPNQSFHIVQHPKTGHRMFAVSSPQEARFASPTGEFTPDEFFRQSLASIVRRDKDLQADNLFGNFSVDQGQAFIASKAGQPRSIGKPSIPVGEQAKINFLMQKGGAKSWFAESTADLAKNMSREDYISGFQKAIDEAHAKARPAIDNLADLTPAEKTLYEGIIQDIEDAKGIDFGSLHDHHAQLVAKIKKPPTEAAVKKAADAKAKKIAQIQESLKAGLPEWLVPGYDGLKSRVPKMGNDTGAASVDFLTLGLGKLISSIGKRIPRRGIESALDRGVLDSKFMDEVSRTIQAKEFAPNVRNGLWERPVLSDIESQVGSSSISKLKKIGKRSSLGDKISSIFESNSSTDMIRIISGSDEGQLMSIRDWKKLYYGVPEEARGYLPEVATVKANTATRTKGITVGGMDAADRNINATGEFLIRPVDVEAWMYAGHFDRTIKPVRAVGTGRTKNSVSNNVMSIEQDFQRLGLATGLIKRQDSVFPRLGVDRNTVETAEAGTSVWGKRGFDLDRYGNTAGQLNRGSSSASPQWLDNMETYGLDAEYPDLYASIQAFKDGRNPGFSIQDIMSNPEASKIFRGSGWYGEKVYPKVEPKKSPVERVLQQIVESQKAKARASTKFSDWYDQELLINSGQLPRPKPTLAQTFLNRLTTPKAERSSLMDRLKGAGSSLKDKLVAPVKARAASKIEAEARLEAEVRANQARKYRADNDRWHEDNWDDAVELDENGVRAPSDEPTLGTYLEENLIKSEVQKLMKEQRISYKAKTILSKMSSSGLSAVGKRVSPIIQKIKSMAKLSMPRGYSPAQPVFNNIKELERYVAEVEASGKSWKDFIDPMENRVIDPETGQSAANDPIMELFMAKNNRRPKLSRTTEPKTNEVALFRGVTARKPEVEPFASIHNKRRVLSLAEHLQNWQDRKSLRVDVGGNINNGSGAHVTPIAGVAAEYTSLGDLVEPAVLKFAVDQEKIKLDSFDEVEKRLIEILGPEHKKYTDPMSFTQKAALAGSDIFTPDLIEGDISNAYEAIILNRSSVRMLGSAKPSYGGSGNVYGAEGSLRGEGSLGFTPTKSTPKILTPQKTISEFLNNQLFKQQYNRFQIENLSISDKFKLLMNGQKQKISKQPSLIQTKLATKLRDSAYNRRLISPAPEDRPVDPFGAEQMSEEEWLSRMLPNYKPSPLQRFFPNKLSSLLNQKADSPWSLPGDHPWRAARIEAPWLEDGFTTPKAERSSLMDRLKARMPKMGDDSGAASIDMLTGGLGRLIPEKSPVQKEIEKAIEKYRLYKEQQARGPSDPPIAQTYAAYKPENFTEPPIGPVPSELASMPIYHDPSRVRNADDLGFGLHSSSRSNSIANLALTPQGHLLDLTFEELNHVATAVENHLAKLTGESDVMTQMSSRGLQGFLREGRLQTNFEGPQSQTNPDYQRMLVERLNFGYPYNLDVTKRPIYGTLGNKYVVNPYADAYGPIKLIFDPKVLDRSTITMDDTFSQSVKSSSARFPRIQSLGKSEMGRESIDYTNLASYSLLDPYVELQMHAINGQGASPSLKDIQEIILHDQSFNDLSSSQKFISEFQNKLGLQNILPDIPISMVHKGRVEASINKTFSEEEIKKIIQAQIMHQSPWAAARTSGGMWEMPSTGSGMFANLIPKLSEINLSQLLSKAKRLPDGSIQFPYKSNVGNLDEFNSAMFSTNHPDIGRRNMQTPSQMGLEWDSKDMRIHLPNIPGLRSGGTINNDNTLANLHQGEMVLTQPLTQKLNDGINNLQYTMASSARLGSLTESTPTAPVANNNTSHYNIQVHPTPGMSEEAVADKVMQKLKDHERRKGMARR